MGGGLAIGRCRTGGAHADEHLERDALGGPPALHDQRALQAGGAITPKRGAGTAERAAAYIARWEHRDGEPGIADLGAVLPQGATSPAVAVDRAGGAGCLRAQQRERASREADAVSRGAQLMVTVTPRLPPVTFFTPSLET